MRTASALPLTNANQILGPLSGFAPLNSSYMSHHLRGKSQQSQDTSGGSGLFAAFNKFQAGNANDIVARVRMRQGKGKLRRGTHKMNMVVAESEWRPPPPPKPPPTLSAKISSFQKSGSKS